MSSRTSLSRISSYRKENLSRKARRFLCAWIASVAFSGSERFVRIEQET